MNNIPKLTKLMTMSASFRKVGISSSLASGGLWVVRETPSRQLDAARVPIGRGWGALPDPRESAARAPVTEYPAPRVLLTGHGVCTGPA